MLVLTRRVGESIVIDLDPALDPSLTAAALFHERPLQIFVTHLCGGQVKLGLRLDERLRVRRTELARRPRA